MGSGLKGQPVLLAFFLLFSSQEIEEKKFTAPKKYCRAAIYVKENLIFVVVLKSTLVTIFKANPVLEKLFCSIFYGCPKVVPASVDNALFFYVYVYSICKFPKCKADISTKMR